ncbi:O-acyltransferase like protein-like [Asterias amurensis]|uniref:O-acyltransferase like protein-like n=1 Tax=Asterias amurensis TaxID=7602 RepID=UPI003AB1B44F
MADCRLLVTVLILSITVFPHAVQCFETHSPKAVDLFSMIQRIGGGAMSLIEQSASAKQAALGWDSIDQDELEEYFNGDVPGIMQQLKVHVMQNRDTGIFQNVTSACMTNVDMFLDDLEQSKTYARQMVHSNGGRNTLANLEFKLLTANYGNFEECELVRDYNKDAPFDTMYCSVLYPYPLTTYARTSLCVPAACSYPELFELTKGIPVIGPYLYYECAIDYPWYAGAIATVCVLCFFLVVVTIGTVYHIAAQRRIQEKIDTTVEDIQKRVQPEENIYESLDEEAVEVKAKTQVDSEKAEGRNGKMVDLDIEEKNGDVRRRPSYSGADTSAARKQLKKLGFLNRLMVSFSCINNGSKILNTEQTAGSLACLNGIRVISMFWIILGHTLQFQAAYWDDIRQPIQQVLPVFLASGLLYSTVSVDTFFMLSGLLLTYHTMKHLKKTNGKMNWLIFYFHRLWRITPVYMLSLVIWACLAIHLGKGPVMIGLFEFAADACGEYWWTNLLYINNLYPFPGDLGLQCMGWSWYLANDMQFFIISPIILYILHKNSKIGITLIVSLCLGSFGITAYLATYFGAPVGLREAYNNNTVVVYGNPSADIIYGKPYCRIQTYLVGMIAGYIFFKLNGKTVKMSKWVNALGWLIAVALGMSVVFGLYRSPDNNEIEFYAAVMYTTFSRFAFAVAVVWVAFSCHFGYGGPVNTLLSWGFWAPLSRITFGAYLLHPTLIYLMYVTSKSLYHFTVMSYICVFLGNVVVSYFAAFLMSIGVEGPLLGLEKAVLGGAGDQPIKPKKSTPPAK